MKTKELIVASMLLMSSPLMSQDSGYKEYPGADYVGLGIGLSYGGIGGRFVLSPIKNVGIILAVGYSLADFGYNVGLMFSIPSEKKTQAYLSGMYGTNAVVLSLSAPELNRSFTGVSFGGGVKVRFNHWSHLDAGLVVPIRSNDYQKYWNSLKGGGGIGEFTNPLPVTINVGYNLTL